MQQRLPYLGSLDPSRDVPWSTVSARLHAGELLLAIEITHDDDTCTIIVAALDLAGATPARLIAQLESTPELQLAVAP